MSKTLLKRREFIAAASAAGGFALGRMTVGGRRPGVAFPPFAKTLEGALREMDLPPAVGEAYLRRDPHGCTFELLAESLRWRLGLSSNEWIWAIFGPDQQELGRMLAAAVREDFEDEEGVCQLEGWYLSRTECQLAAARYLLISQGRLEIPLEAADVPYPQKEVYKVSRWGPQSTPLGEPFNPQPGGRAALWIHASGVSSQGVVYIGNHEMRTTVREELITASLPSEVVEELVSRHRRLIVQIVDPKREVRQRVGVFTVGEPPGR